MQQRLQSSRTITVYPHDTVAIPEPSSLGATGTNTAFATDQLTDSTATFLAGIKPGFIVYNVTDGATTEVISVDSDTQLTLLDDIFGAASKTYKIYSKACTGALLYVGVSGGLDVITSGNDTQLFTAAPVGYHPVHVTHVKATLTTATNIVALF